MANLRWLPAQSCDLSLWRLAESNNHNAYAWVSRDLRAGYRWSVAGGNICGVATSEAEALELAGNAFLEKEIRGG